MCGIYADGANHEFIRPIKSTGHSIIIGLVADESSLDKKATSHSDVFDAFRMSLQYWTNN
jgi:hypothetical protein